MTSLALKRAKIILIVCLLLLVPIFIVRVDADSSSGPRLCGLFQYNNSNVEGSNRLLILLQGIGTNYINAESSYQHIVNGIGHLYHGVVYFSYDSSNPYAYSPDDTQKGVYQNHIAALTKLLDACKSRYPNITSVDIIGHSLGGVTGELEW